MDRTYIAIDLKSFYASVECVERGLDPLQARLVVADESRTNKTICLAVTPALKAYGIPGRARLFEVEQKAKALNLDYIVAPPRMRLYMNVSARVYSTYLNYISADDIHVYSIDEVFMDVTDYLRLYGCTAHQLAMRMIRDVLSATGITATAGIAPNLYLAKVAMDIEAKHCQADADGVRIAELDELSYRRKYWTHTPLTDFWRVGKGIARRLESHGMHTMGDVARMSLIGEEVLYKLFGVNAELLIDHAWGWEPCTIAQVKAYRPSTHSISSGQVLSSAYTVSKARTVLAEMADALSMELVWKRMLCDQIVVSVVYDSTSLNRCQDYSGPIVINHYGKEVPKPAHGSSNLGDMTSSTREIVTAALSVFDRITDPRLLVRQLCVVANHTCPEDQTEGVQLKLFSDSNSERERRRQDAILAIRQRFGSNSILKGINFEEGATQIQRNAQIGGHKAE